MIEAHPLDADWPAGVGKGCANDTASALSTATSGGSGQLACGGGLWTYQAFHYYADLSSGTPGCYHNASVIYIYT